MPRSELNKEDFGVFAARIANLGDQEWESLVRARNRIRELKAKQKVKASRMKKPKPEMQP